VETKIKKILVLTTILALLSLFFVHFTLASDSNGTIDPSHEYAWGDNLGWINFACSNCNVHITDTGLTGYAWSRQYGWINLSPSGGGVTNNCLGQLNGYAWSSALGWLNFSGTSIDFNGKFTGQLGSASSKSGKINFDCSNCNVQTDWRQCSLRSSPPQVRITSISDNSIPSISANIIMTNEGSVGTEYQYEWCVVTSEDNACGGGDDVFYAQAAKFIDPGINKSYVTSLEATVPNEGTYWFKLVAHYGDLRSIASQVFIATANQGGGGGGGGGTGTITPTITPTPTEKPKVEPPVEEPITNVADFNKDGVVDSTDFSILLYFWNKKAPFSNPAVDINKDGVVDFVDFSILLYQWGKHS